MIEQLSSKDAISIIICHTSDVTARNMAEHICRGVEEEQMPARLVEKSGTSLELARFASEISLLAIGVGVDQSAVITLTHFQMPSDTPVMQITSAGKADLARMMGSNAARLYNRTPFIFES
jgi:hypothetical protein